MVAIEIVNYMQPQGARNVFHPFIRYNVKTESGRILFSTPSLNELISLFN